MVVVVLEDVKEKWCKPGHHNVSITNFGKQERSPDGLRYCCKDCNSRLARESRVRNIEKARQSSLRYRQENKKSIAQKNREYRQQQGEVLKQKKKEYYQQNKDHIREKVAKYKKENADRVNAWNRNRQSLKRTQGNGNPVDYKSILERDGMWCYLDGHTIEEKYEFDHIEPVSKGGGHTEENIAITCPTHNNQKKDKTLLEYMLVNR